MLDLSAIILTFNEELHIKRCLDNLSPVVKEIFIIDSYSTDRTLEIAKKYEQVTILQNKWVNYATQFNWGLKNAPINTEWVIRLDADEYLLTELIEELKQKLPALNKDVTGITLKRRHIFLGRWMKRGTYPVKLLRIFKAGKAICEERFMDEHIQLLEGTNVEMNNDFVDENLNNLSWWATKHVGYAIREAVDLLDIELNLTNTANSDENKQISEQAHQKRMLKHKYAMKPLFWRSFAYFCYRYFFKLGFLEGKEGFLWHFLQGWWYRTLVDAKIFEIKKACGDDKEKIKTYLREVYNIVL
ncbi:MAG: glycosyltransferase family 2 protein [Alistipes sp.]|nr:glycosyltransferase family 2 protein [Alistipes sp.]